MAQKLTFQTLLSQHWFRPQDPLILHLNIAVRCGLTTHPLAWRLPRRGGRFPGMELSGIPCRWPTRSGVARAVQRGKMTGVIHLGILLKWGYISLNYQFLGGFSINYKPSSYWGTPIYGTPQLQLIPCQDSKTNIQSQRPESTCPLVQADQQKNEAQMKLKCLDGSCRLHMQCLGKVRNMVATCGYPGWTRNTSSFVPFTQASHFNALCSRAIWTWKFSNAGLRHCRTYHIHVDNCVYIIVYIYIQMIQLYIFIHQVYRALLSMVFLWSPGTWPRKWTRSRRPPKVRWTRRAGNPAINLPWLGMVWIQWWWLGEGVWHWVYHILR